MVGYQHEAAQHPAASGQDQLQDQTPSTASRASSRSKAGAEVAHLPAWMYSRCTPDTASGASSLASAPAKNSCSYFKPGTSSCGGWVPHVAQLKLRNCSWAQKLCTPACAAAAGGSQAGADQSEPALHAALLLRHVYSQPAGTHLHAPLLQQVPDASVQQQHIALNWHARLTCRTGDSGVAERRAAAGSSKAAGDELRRHGNGVGCGMRGCSTT